MRFRPVALFLLSAGFAVLLGELAPVDAQTKEEKKQKRLEKLLKKATPAPRPVTEPDEVPPPRPPLPTVVPVPTKPDAVALARLIDAEINKKLAEAKIEASPPASDEEFLRRAYLDITGTIPTAEQARTFLDSREPDKRARLIDELLASPGYGRRMADIWIAKLFPRDSANRFVLRQPLYKWLEDEFNANTPWDRFVSKLVTAEGTVEENPATTYFLANRSIDKLTDTTAQHFLGIQLQCAQCHNHPFTDWKQAEYWGMAAFYSKVKIDNPRNANKGGDNTKIGVTEGPGRTKAKDFFPESTKYVAAKFLSGPHPALSDQEPYRPVLAKWLTSPDNPFFARALVNRTWAHLFGTGFVNPIDDMLPENTPSHPELLDALARHISTTGRFDVKYLIKAICLSDAYQRTSKPTPGNKDDRALFSHMTMKVMTPEQLFDSLAQVTGFDKSMARGKGAKLGAPLKGQASGPRDQFVDFFLAGAESTSRVDYEAGIPQALRLMNSPIANNPAVARTIVGPTLSSELAFERIYLTVLSRRPTAEEKKLLAEYLAKVGSPPTAYTDILWATLNSSEFTLIR